MSLPFTFTLALSLYSTNTFSYNHHHHHHIGNKHQCHNLLLSLLQSHCHYIQHFLVFIVIASSQWPVSDVEKNWSYFQSRAHLRYELGKSLQIKNRVNLGVPKKAALSRFDFHSAHSPREDPRYSFAILASFDFFHFETDAVLRFWGESWRRSQIFRATWTWTFLSQAARGFALKLMMLFAIFWWIFISWWCLLQSFGEFVFRIYFLLMAVPDQLILQFEVWSNCTRKSRKSKRV